MTDTQSTPNQTRADTIRLLQRNWLAEADGARVYRELAANEKSEKRREIMIRMAEAEERHAARWAAKLAELGARPPALPEGIGTRLRRWWNRAAGTDLAIRRQEAAEDRDIARYNAQQKLAHEDVDIARILHETEMEERAHARAFQAMVPQLGPQTVLDVIFKRERWHGRGGGWVSDAIYGANDGLGAVFGIVSGVAGIPTTSGISC